MMGLYYFLLGTVNELHELFKTRNPDIKIGKTRFLELKPKECIHLNHKGIHNICVCRYHENFKLMALALDNILKTPTIGKTWKEHIKLSVCYEPTDDCYIRKCQNCPEIEDLVSLLRTMITDTDDDSTISYQAWVCTDRADIVTKTLPISDFLIEYAHQLLDIKRHDFITKKQQDKVNQIKESLASGEALILLDFAQNYPHVTQDSIQNQYYNQTQTTIHPAVYYFKDGDELKHKSLVFVSDSLVHDSLFVYCVIKKLISIIKKDVPNLKHVEYFTDGAPSQYKNKKIFLNILYHLQDFGCTARHHFYATGHGKGPIDGIGGNSKRVIYMEAMARTNGQSPIKNAYDICQCLKNKNTVIEAVLITEEFIKEHKEPMEERWKLAKTIKGTLNYHCFYPSSHNVLSCKFFSTASTSFDHQLISEK